MRRSLFLLGLIAAIPALAWGQEPKLANCRSLEAAGNFVGPDEVIVNDMVCQKVKPGTEAAAKPQTPKPLMGTTISDTSADSVVEAAKAAERRVAIRREAEAQKTAAEAAAAAAANAAAPETAAAAAAERVAEPTAGSPEKAEPAVAAPPDNPQPEPAAAAAEPPTPKTASALAPAGTPVEQAGVGAPPQPAPPAAPATASPNGESTAPEPQAPSEIVSSSAPASAQATAPAVEPKTEPAAEAAAPVAAPPASAAPAAGSVAPAPDPQPGASSGFYDANAPKPSTNAAPQTDTGFASAEQVKAGPAPGTTTIPPVSRQPAAQAAAPEAEPEHTTIAAARVDFDADRDRSVKTGDFAKPTDVSTDPAGMEHRTSVDPSEADGFQDRQRAECTKNITLGALKGEKLVLGVPAWAARWIEKNEKRMPEICFSETPMKTARNYLIVFSTPAGAASSKDIGEAVLKPAKGSTTEGVGTFTTSYGSTWHYSYDRNVGITVLTQDDADEPHGQPGQVLYATGYTEEGVPVSQRWPGELKKEFKPGEKNKKKLKVEAELLERLSGDLLSQMIDDIEKL